MISPEECKQRVGARAAELVAEGMSVGLGTGSTAAHFLESLGARVRRGLRIRAVATSERTAARAQAAGIPLVSLEECPRLDLAIDGADEVDPRGDLIKGLGGALLREKLVARAAAEFVVIVDESKMVKRLGLACPVPVEVERESWRRAAEALGALGAETRLRGGVENPFVTDNDNLIVDAHFGAIPQPARLEGRINGLAGVLENGLFPGMADRVLIGGPRGVREWLPRRGPPQP